MKRWCVGVILLLILVGCRSTPFDGNVVIDWVDFIKLDGKEYNGIYSGVLADKSFIGNKIGEVKFKVADNVTNSSYRIRNGDAAFHEKGTEIYEVIGHPYLIAVQSDHAINGYKVYFSRDDQEYEWQFKDMPMDKVKMIEIYYSHTAEGLKLIANLTKEKEIEKLLQLLINSETNPAFQQNSEYGDPLYYEMIFYTDDPVAYRYMIYFDGMTYFWHPWDTAIISNDIEKFLE